MAHFAQLNENNIVVNVIVVGNDDIKDENGVEQEQLGIEFCKNLLGQDKTWIQTSWSGRIRKNFAGIGYTYDSNRDAFIPEKPHNSWVLVEETCKWTSPVPLPSDAGTFAEDGTYITYDWNEDTISWDKKNVLIPQE